MAETKKGTIMRRRMLLAQSAVGAAHTAILVFMCFATYFDFARLDTHMGRLFVVRGLAMSVAYFVADSLFIACFEMRDQGQYLLHHAVAIAMYALVLSGCVHLGSVRAHLLAIELSNVFLTPWHWAKDPANGARTAYEVLTPLLAVTYVPLRGLVMPVTGAAVLVRSFGMASMPAFAALAVLLITLQAMSSWFAWRLASIAAAKTERWRNGGLPLDFYIVLRPDSPFWFGTAVYVAKLFHDVFLLTGAPSERQQAMLLVDAAHILASVVYFASGCAPDADALDYGALLAKIALQGGVLLARRMDAVGAVIVVGALLHDRAMAARARPDHHDRVVRFVAIAALFLRTVVSVAVSATPLTPQLLACVAAYSAGGLAWAAKWPEGWVRGRGLGPPAARLFNSIGLLHAMVWVGDGLMYPALR